MESAKRTFVFDLFEYLAPRYDRFNNWLSLGQHRRWRKSSLKMIGLLNNCVVVDFCCGSGDFVEAVIQHSSSAKLIGLDFSPKMLEVAKARFDLNRNGNQALLVTADVLSPPLKIESADLITIGFALRNVINLQALFRVVFDTLRPDGKFLAMELSRQHIPIFWWGHRLYLRTIVPLWGRLILDKKYPARYLARSIEMLPQPKVIMTMLIDAGFIKVRRKTYMFGAISVYVAAKGGSSGCNRFTK